MNLAIIPAEHRILLIPQLKAPTSLGLAVVLLVSLAASGCDSSSKEAEPPDFGNNPASVVTAHPIVGTWQTSGTHERLGEVEIVMTLEADGTLRMVVELPSGGSVSFPGSWEVADESLVLRGAFFADEVSEVSWALSESGSLILADSTGSTQDWSPVET